MKTFEELYEKFKEKFGDKCWSKFSGKAVKFYEEYSPDCRKIKDYFSLEGLYEDYSNSSFVVYYFVIEDENGIIRFSDGCGYLASEESFENHYGDYISRKIIDKNLKKYKVTVSEKYPLEMFVVYDDEDYKKLFSNLVNCRIDVCCEAHKNKTPYPKFSF